MKKRILEKFDAVPRWAVPFVGICLLIIAALAVCFALVLVPIWLPLLLGWMFFVEMRGWFSAPPPYKALPGWSHGGPKPIPPTAAEAGAAHRRALNGVSAENGETLHIPGIPPNSAPPSPPRPTPAVGRQSRFG